MACEVPLDRTVEQDYEDLYQQYCASTDDGVEQLSRRVFKTLASRWSKDTDNLRLLLLLDYFLLDMHRIPEKLIDTLSHHFGSNLVAAMLASRIEHYYEESFVGTFYKVHHNLDVDQPRTRRIYKTIQALVPYLVKWNKRRADEILSHAELMYSEKPRPRLVSKPDDRTMDSYLFWDLLEEASLSSRHMDVRCRWLRDRLEGFKPKEIIAFSRILGQEHIARYTYRNWAVGYLVNGGLSLHGLLGWLFLQGRDFVKSFDENADAIIELKNSNEWYMTTLLFDVPSEAFDMVTMRDFPMSAFVHIPEEPSGKPWAKEELAKMFPNIHRAFHKTRLYRSRV